MDKCIKCNGIVYSCKLCKKHYTEELKNNEHESKWLKRLRFQNTFLKEGDKIL
jgi:hypothetical protein